MGEMWDVSLRSIRVEIQRIHELHMPDTTTNGFIERVSNWAVKQVTLSGTQALVLYPEDFQIILESHNKN